MGWFSKISRVFTSRGRSEDNNLLFLIVGKEYMEVAARIRKAKRPMDQKAYDRAIMDMRIVRLKASAIGGAGGGDKEGRTMSLRPMPYFNDNPIRMALKQAAQDELAEMGLWPIVTATQLRESIQESKQSPHGDPRK